MFDDTGRRYAIQWIPRNRLWLTVLEDQEYELVPDGTIDGDALAELIRSATLVEPESRRPWLADLARKLAQASDSN